MSGKSIPYHLRPNKSVERSLFIQSLGKINKYLNISEYQYIGFGAAFLEDFKVLHHELKISDMISIEFDENVWKRQQFNKPISCINFLDGPRKSSDFIREHDFDKKSITWLDYVSFDDLYNHLVDVSDLLGKLSDGDIFKVTLNANSANLGMPEGSTQFLEYRFKRFKNLVTSEYEPFGVEQDDMVNKEFPKVLLKSLKRAVSKGVKSSPNLEAVPISAFVYEDAQKMLTLMGIVLKKEKVEEFFEVTGFKSWSYFSKDWDKPKNISLPVMSARERLFVEQMLPGADSKLIASKLQFYIGSTEKTASEQMENFISYYRALPWFGKVSTAI